MSWPLTQSVHDFTHPNNAKVIWIQSVLFFWITFNFLGIICNLITNTNITPLCCVSLPLCTDKSESEYNRYKKYQIPHEVVYGHENSIKINMRWYTKRRTWSTVKITNSNSPDVENEVRWFYSVQSTTNILGWSSFTSQSSFGRSFPSRVSKKIWNGSLHSYHLTFSHVV
jgi:hypothetical protein